MKKAFILMMLLLLPVASAQEVIVEPLTYIDSNITLIGGDNVSQVLRVKYTGNTNVVAKIITEIKGTVEDFNGNEINISYEPGNTITLKPNEWKNVTMRITSVPHLMPDSYSIITKVSVEQDTTQSSSSSNSYTPSSRRTSQILYILNNTVINDTCTDELEKIKLKLSNIERENNLDESFNTSKLYHKINQTEEENEQLRQDLADAYFYLLVFIIATVFLSYVYGVLHVKSKNSKLPDSSTQRGKEHKKSTTQPGKPKKDSS